MASLLTHPTTARRDAPYPKQGRSSAADPRFMFHASRFTVPWERRENAAWVKARFGAPGLGG
jgi:hypothetical protein